jgi:short-subunit dehydrogenase
MKSENSSVAIVTGASSGIGEALVTQMVREGFRVAGLARNQTGLQALADRLEGPGEFLPIPCDVGTEVDVVQAVARVVGKWGRIDWAIGNAGFGVVGKVCDLKPEDYHRQFAVNFFGVLYLVQASLPELRKSHGRLGIVGSVNSYVSLPGNSAYAVSKFMTRALAESLTAEERGDGVSVTFIAPGFVKTRIRNVNNRNVVINNAPDPISDWIQMPATDAASKIIRAMRRRREVVVVTLHARLIIWLNSLSPSLWSWLVRRFGVRARTEPR